MSKNNENGPPATQIEAVRRFSRFYTRRIGVLEEGLLRSPFPLPEARVVYELAQVEGIRATALAERLRLDAGYVSRLLGRLEEAGVVVREVSEEDGRVRVVTLTKAGRAAFAKLDRTSRDEVARMLADVPDARRNQLVQALATAEEILGDEPTSPAIVLRPPEPGDLGWMIQSQSRWYAATRGWGAEFEALTAQIVANFLEGFDPAREHCWIAEADGINVGAVLVCAHSETVAQLRMLWVDPAARGRGIGRLLVAGCTRFARSAGYESIMLWTNRGLDAARRIYEHEGYRLVREEEHDDLGKPEGGQFWEMAL
jgi:DNA-binding MarR family transcriptional regulator/GNAT superfamily N-acetyltransferase